MMNEYWLILESYVFIWKNDIELVIYNSLSGKGFKINCCREIDILYDDFIDKKNLYVTSVTQEQLNIPAIMHFIMELRNSFCGDLYNKKEFPYKPIVIIPEVSVNEDVDIILNNKIPKDKLGENITNNLLGLTVQLTGRCNEKCKKCNTTNKQLVWCNKNTGILEPTKLISLINRVKHTQLINMSFIGGDLLSYPYWDRIIPLLEDSLYTKMILLHWNHYKDNRKKVELFINKGFKINVIINPEQINSTTNLATNIPYISYVTSIEQYEDILKVTEDNQIMIKILPLYTGKNISFFEEFVYQSEEEILNTSWKQRNIFAHQRLNTHTFGRLYIDSYGFVYSDINNDSIGKIEEPIESLVYNEIKSGKSWLKTRDSVEPCKPCIYKYLCPSLSNYEKAIGKMNLCWYKTQ